MPKQQEQEEQHSFLDLLATVADKQAGEQQDIDLLALFQDPPPAQAPVPQVLQDILASFTHERKAQALELFDQVQVRSLSCSSVETQNHHRSLWSGHPGARECQCQRFISQFAYAFGCAGGCADCTISSTGCHGWKETA